MQEICKASEYGLVHRGSMMDKLYLELGKVNKDNDGELDGDRIVI